MMDFFRRRRRLVLGLAAGAAGAVAAYYWWTGYTTTKVQQQRSVEMELSAILRGAALNQGADVVEDAFGTADVAEDTDADADDCGSPDLDESLDNHFNYIQTVSAPQELSNLLPRIKDTLFRLTDVAPVKRQLQQQRAASVEERARMLARLSFGRTVAAAFLLPLIDLSVRTKLNIIGRHLFLQEKFSKLRQPAAPAARMRLPPRLTTSVVEAFLGCEHLAEQGCAWLVEQAMSATDTVLAKVPMSSSKTPEEVAELVQSVASALGQAVTAAGAASATGSAWVDAVVGSSSSSLDPAAAAGSATDYQRARANAAMVEELDAELRRVLSNYRFSEALHAAVGQCLSTCYAHIHATFISQAQQQQQQQQRQAPQSPAPTPCPSDTMASPAPLPDQQQQQEQEPKQRQSPVVSPFSNAQDSAGPAMAVADGAAEPQSERAARTASSAAPAAEYAESCPRRRTGGSGGGAPGGARASLAAAAIAAMQPRPLPLCLKVVQGACDPLFVDAREVSARIACLPPVMSLCAIAFAAPLEL